MRYLPMISLLCCLPLTLQAESCKAILDKLPKHSPESSIFAKQVDDYIKSCHERPGMDDPDKLKNCIIVGMRALGVVGNYVAAEHMAMIECEQGNEEISKNWMGMVINNNNASDLERTIASEAINSNKEDKNPYK